MGEEPETALAMAERHVREAEARIARQAEIIAEMERDNHPEAAAVGRGVLATFQNTLEALRDHFSLVRGLGDAGVVSKPPG